MRLNLTYANLTLSRTVAVQESLAVARGGLVKAHNIWS